MITGFENMDISIFKNASSEYLPKVIKYLLIAESPPAFSNSKPEKYFYFSDFPGADLLFYSVIKAIYDHDFVKGIDDRKTHLRKFAEDGYFLIDSVDYPINKTRAGNDVSNSVRERIILSNKFRFMKKLKRLANEGVINLDTHVILIKETVYNVYSGCSFLSVINEKPLHFPSYVKDKRFANDLRSILKFK